jgi:conserved oligomeric Golgi complex subunit 2
VEEVRVGLLSFQRELGLIRSKVESRRHDVATLMEDKRSLKQDIMLGRALLEIAERIEDLEGHLMIGETTQRKSDNGLLDGNTTTTDDGAASDSFSEDSDEEYSADEYRPRVRRLERLVEQYLMVQVLIRRHGAEHLFIVAQEERLHQIQVTLRLDIEATMKQVQETDLVHGESMEGGSSRSLLQLRQLLISEGTS